MDVNLLMAQLSQGVGAIAGLGTSPAPAQERDLVDRLPSSSRVAARLLEAARLRRRQILHCLVTSEHRHDHQHDSAHHKESDHEQPPFEPAQLQQTRLRVFDLPMRNCGHRGVARN